MWRTQTFVSGAIQKEVYLELINADDFTNMIQKEKPIIIPDDILKNYLTEKEIQQELE
mgnify:CR=1 FL=1